MQLQKFKITSKKLDGSLCLVYEDGHLKSILNEFKQPINTKGWELIKPMIPFKSIYLDGMKFVSVNLKLELISDTTPKPNDRIAAFCKRYEELYGVKYKVCGSDAGKMKALSVPNEIDFKDLVEVYLLCTEWWCKTKSIANLVKHINEIVLLLVKGNATENGPKMNFPDGYSKAFEKECTSPVELQAYWQHLHKMGWERKQVGMITCWVKN
ncbi:hypothetical protein [Solitalea koreensis]|uniref:Uncharacterized protein n=1 Tax=Solitalea koreensis TaxID=543615 RepID=A0A521BMG7_9SPHI|nr:hypothetical protein [Solitalea koreensis]SMO48292.1 hypothetical protein SAMN06265350_102338 [Solitalea koreensis]